MFTVLILSSVLPDANKNATINAIIGAAFGAAGQRCMALSALVLVGEAKEWLPEIVEKAKHLSVTAGFEEGADLGPVISPHSLKRIEGLVQSGVDAGAKLLLDGRGYRPEKYPNGNFVRRPSTRSALCFLC
jgi:malonate-semialdehyde dehydrogenase (acetylating)/methylmalonate-semialdehyde dehydrogenase